MSFREIFGEILADHHENPRNNGKLDNPTIVKQGSNPICGDRVTINVELKEADKLEVLSKVSFEGEGCIMCLASASIMTEIMIDKSTLEANKIIESFKTFLQSSDDTVSDPVLLTVGDDIHTLFGIKKYPARLKCVLLSWITLKTGLLNHEK